MPIFLRFSSKHCHYALHNEPLHDACPVTMISNSSNTWSLWRFVIFQAQFSASFLILPICPLSAAIARAIAQAPPIILADEPTGNLDSGSTKEIMGILKGLHEEGRTVILITHDNEIAAQAKRVIKIMDGRIVSDSAEGEEKVDESIARGEQNHE